MSEADELERLRKEAAELRALVRELSATLVRTVDSLPLGAALALAKRGEADLEPPSRLEHWNESSELTRVNVLSELGLLWKRLPSREKA